MSAPAVTPLIVAGWIIGSIVICSVYGWARSRDRHRRTVVRCHQPTHRTVVDRAMPEAKP